MIAWRKVREKLRVEQKVYSCVFRTKQDFVLGTGTRGNKRSWKLGGMDDSKLKGGVETFAMDDSVYADDTGALFCSREECERGTPPLINLIERFGGEVHVKKAGQQKESKSVVLFFVANQTGEYDRHSSEEGGAATFGGADLSHIAVGGGSTVAVVKEAKYLGSWMDTSRGWR